MNASATLQSPVSDDAQLLHAWRAGDNASGSELFRRHFTAVRRFFANKVNADEVDDLIQRTFTGCVEGVDRFRGDASFRTFLFAIARRQLYKFLRDTRSRDDRVDPDLSASSVAALGRTPTSIIAAREEEAILVRALQDVSVEHQVMLELHYWEQLPNDQIAEVFDISPTTVRTRLFRARKALQEIIDAELTARGKAPGSVDVERTAASIATA